MAFKTLKRILFSGIFKMKINLMEDPTKVAIKIAELNRTGGDWIAANGTNALTNVSGDFRTNANIVFQPSNGIPVKVFMNKTNGEMKLFPAVLFERDV